LNCANFHAFKNIKNKKVSYFGLPAAGIICLSLLNHPSSIQQADVSVSKVIQDLSVLVAKVDTGALITVENPNYALLTEATRTVKTLLDRLSISVVTTQNNAAGTAEREVIVNPESLPPPPSPSLSLPRTMQDEWMPWLQQNTWDFELDFWNDLAEHAILMDV